MTVQQNKVWKNSETLWTHVLKYYQNSTLPYGNRANYLRQEGRIQEALRDYGKATTLNPNGEQAFNSRARLYFDIAKTRDTLLLALADYNRAIELAPNNGEFLVNRGATHARLGQIDKAIADINEGLRYKPDHAVGYLNRSVLYNGQGKIQEALNDINSYLNLKPYNADLWYEKGRALRNLNRLQESLPAYSRAIQLNNRQPVFHYERGRTYFAMGKTNEAKLGYSNGIKLRLSKCRSKSPKTAWDIDKIKMTDKQLLFETQLVDGSRFRKFYKFSLYPVSIYLLYGITNAIFFSETKFKDWDTLNLIFAISFLGFCDRLDCSLLLFKEKNPKRTVDDK